MTDATGEPDPAPRGETETESEREREYDLDRTIAFSDGVFAIAITLLVLNLDVPDIPQNHLDELPARLWDLRSQFLVYILSFWVVGRFWLIHHRLFGQLRGVDATLAGINLVLLALVALVPFPTALLGEYVSQPIAVTAYAVELAAVSAVSAVIPHYANRAGLLHEKGKRDLQRWGYRSFLIPVILLAAIPFAYLVSASWAPLIWLLIGPATPNRLRRPRGFASDAWTKRD